jgi:hypothetical protein
MPPYLIWSEETSGKQASWRRLKKTASSLSALRVVGPKPPASLEVTRSAIADTGLTSPASAIGTPRDPIAYKPRTAKISRADIALEMRVPANALVHLIGGPKRGTMAWKAAPKIGASTPASLAAKKVTVKGATSAPAKPQVKKPMAKKGLLPR